MGEEGKICILVVLFSGESRKSEVGNLKPEVRGLKCVGGLIFVCLPQESRNIL